MYLPRIVMESRGLKAEKENTYRSSFQPPISRQSNPSVTQMLRNFEKIPDVFDFRSPIQSIYKNNNILCCMLYENNPKRIC